MDKSYKKLYVFIGLIILICVAIWGVKDFKHRTERKHLLAVNPVIKSCIKKDSIESEDSNNLVKKKEQSEYKLEANSVVTNEEDDEFNESDKKINKSSSNIELKTNDSVDFTNESEEIKDKNEIDNKKDNMNINDNENLQLLARLIQSEAGDEPYDGKIAVGNVVLNRAREDSQSIENVIYAKNQFDGVQTSNFRREPDSDCIKAAQEVLMGKEISDSYYFVNLKYASPSWAKESTFEKRIGDHWFFRKE